MKKQEEDIKFNSKRRNANLKTPEPMSEKDEVKKAEDVLWAKNNKNVNREKK